MEEDKRNKLFQKHPPMKKYNGHDRINFYSILLNYMLMNFIVPEISQTDMACLPAKFHETSMMEKSVRRGVFMYP